ncbi:hypothetical protein WBP_0319 [Wolbachia endosymbiont of Brugia pahangi]|nr:hypothetical protein WBP_0319 [Wolbachia endosymbiont of Brugia pahangi]
MQKKQKKYGGTIKEAEEIVASRFSHEVSASNAEKGLGWDVAYENLRSLPCRRFAIFL